uniref:Uncharacterized protein n=1 Tax=Ralstonia solanacearum TaxID=305 RepID=A0A0S4WKQ5_RALSL|nr:protein of unknown function [Ralstonia solanacearum]
MSCWLGKWRACPCTRASRRRPETHAPLAYTAIGVEWECTKVQKRAMRVTGPCDNARSVEQPLPPDLSAWH